MQPEQYQPNNIQQAVATAPSPATSALEGYTSNPFLVGLKSLVATLKTNPVVVMLTPLVLIGFIFVVILFSVITAIVNSTAGSVISIILMLFAYLLIAPWMLSTYYTIAASSMRSEHINMSEAVSSGFKRAFPMLGLVIVTSLLVGLGLILLIIPGVILLGRISLAPAVLVAEKVGVFAAISRSFTLTKGHTIEMLGALMAGGIFGTNGILAPYFGVTQMVGRYQDLKALEGSSQPKPPIHWLNIALVALVPVMIALFALIITVSFKNARDTAKQNNQKSQQMLNESFNRYNRDLDFNYDY
jgi:hypothetical protein